jgi:transcriptional regulator with XRE-family HTH domain
MNSAFMAKPAPDLEMQKRVGENLALARGRRSQREIAAESGVDLSTINRIENGKHNPSLATLSAIATAVGISVEHLLKGPGGVSLQLEPQAAVLAHQQSLEKRVSGLEQDLLTAGAMAHEALALAQQLRDARSSGRPRRAVK